MDELSRLIKQNVHGDTEKTYCEISSILDDNLDINSLITWIKINSISRELKPEEVLNMARFLKKRHA